jgi:hypothetical protein
MRWRMRSINHSFLCLIGRHEYRSISKGTLADLKANNRDRIENMGVMCMWCRTPR